MARSGSPSDAKLWNSTSARFTEKDCASFEEVGIKFNDRGCGAGWNPAADCQSASPSFAFTSSRPIDNRPQDSILPHLLQAGAIDPLAIQHHLIDLAEVPHIFERIGVEQQEVGPLSSFDRAQLIQLAQRQRPILCGC